MLGLEQQKAPLKAPAVRERLKNLMLSTRISQVQSTGLPLIFLRA